MKFARRRVATSNDDSATWAFRYLDSLASSDDAFRFSVAVNFGWSLDRLMARPANSLFVAARQVNEILEPYATCASVLRASSVERDMNVALGACFPRCSGGVCIHYAQVSVEVDRATLDAAQRLEEQRRELTVEKLQRERIQARMDFFRDIVLRDPASARIFWTLERQGDSAGEEFLTQLNKLVRDVGLWTPENRWVVVAQLILEFTKRLPDVRKERLIDHLAKIFVEYGEPGLAEDLPRSSVGPDLKPSGSGQ